MSNFIVETLPAISETDSAAWVTAAANAARNCDPPAGITGRGLVIPAGGHYLTSAWIAIKTIRHFGAQLPIQVWHLGPQEMPKTAARCFEALGVTLVDAHAVRETYPHKRLHGWELKAYALLHCPWREVIFLDADNIPVQNIDKLFDTPSYTKFGALFWPDRGRWPADSRIWQMTGITYRDEAEFEAGQIIVDRQRCWRELVLANAFNEESEFWYRYVHGDKDTFRLAWRALNTEYGMVAHYGDGGWPIFHQKDEDGALLFHHGIKWDTRPNTSFKLVPDVCNQFLAEFLVRTTPPSDKPNFAPPEKTTDLLPIDTGLPSNIGIDKCHIDHIYGVARALKPTALLEIGLGTGATATALLSAIAGNQRGHLTVVDNWFDFGGQRPALPAFNQSRVTVITADELKFIQNAAPVYDLIVSDADHNNAHRWWEDTVQLVKPGGCVFFHDVTYHATPNLLQIYNESRERYAVQLFNTSTTPDEACDRGLLVVWRGHAPTIRPAPRVAVLQFATGAAAAFLDCAKPVHAHACKKYGYDYIVENAPAAARDNNLTVQRLYWEKQRMLSDAANAGYEFICWLDADALWLGEAPLLDVWANANPAAVFAATFHGPRHDGVGHHYDHANAGVLFVRNINNAAVAPLMLWGSLDDGGHPWGDQHSLNQLFNAQPALVHIVGHEWNTVVWSQEYSAPAPKIVAWHGKPELVMQNMPKYVRAYAERYGL